MARVIQIRRITTATILIPNSAYYMHLQGATWITPPKKEVMQNNRFTMPLKVMAWLKTADWSIRESLNPALWYSGIFLASLTKQWSLDRTLIDAASYTKASTPKIAGSMNSKKIETPLPSYCVPLLLVNA